MKNFDQASTTKVNEEVLNTYIKSVKELTTHPDSDPKLARLRVQVKEKIKSLLGINHDVIFTSGGTEANNLAIIGYAKKFDSKKHFITSSYEHPSVLNSFKHLETLGHSVSYIEPNNQGVIEVNDVINCINQDTVLVSIMAVNNEIGTSNDIKLISKKVKEVNNKIVVMSDCVQAISYLSSEELNYLDMFVISAHKINGLKGSGILFKKDNIIIDNILYGGSNESGIRPGTQDLAKEVAFLKAIELLKKKSSDNCSFNYLKQQLSQIEGISINVDSNSHIINISINTNMMAESIKNYLYEQGYFVSTKSACSSMLSSRSNVLQAIGIEDDIIDHSIRISISNEVDKKDIDEFIKHITNIIN